MEEEITTKIAEELMKIKGEARGVHFKNDADFVLKLKGEEGLVKVEKELEKLGYTIKYKEINQFDFYPVGLRALSLLVIKKAFDWSDKEIKELCGYAMKFSWIIKLLMRSLFSIEKILKETPKTWSKYFNIGEAEIEKYDLDKKYVILKIKNFDLHPIYCRCIEGVITGGINLVLKTKKMSCEEFECPFKEGKEHKYLIKWE
jgi:hypothetical protein